MNVEGAVTSTSWVPSQALVRRIKNAYQINLASYRTASVPSWFSFGPDRDRIHAALNSDDDAEATRILSDPASTYIYYGMDNLFLDRARHNHEAIAGLADELQRLAQALGASGAETETMPDVEMLLEGLDSVLKVKVDFPNPFRGEFGLKTSRGIASFRAVQALYQAWRIRELCNEVGGRKVLEIGAGAGRTVLYCHRLGITDYRVVDLPATLVGISLFLAGTIGEDAIWMAGDPDDVQQGRVLLLAPTTVDWTQPLDLVANVDSLTEMRREDAERYFLNISGCSARFLSINREANWFSVKDMPRALGVACKVDRQTCPTWPELVEEVYSFDQSLGTSQTPGASLQLRWLGFGLLSRLRERRWSAAVKKRTAAGLERGP
jgi:hypothetical protein